MEAEMAQAQAMIEELVGEKQATIQLLRQCQTQLEAQVGTQGDVIAQQAAELARLRSLLAAADAERAQIEVQVGKYIVESQDRIAELERRLADERRVNLLLAQSSRSRASTPRSHVSAEPAAAARHAPPQAPRIAAENGAGDGGGRIHTPAHRVNGTSAGGSGNGAAVGAHMDGASSGYTYTYAGSGRGRKRSPHRATGGWVASTPHAHVSMQLFGGQAPADAVQAPSPRTAIELRQPHEAHLNDRRALGLPPEYPPYPHGSRSAADPGGVAPAPSGSGSATAQVAALQSQLLTLSAETASVLSMASR